METIKICHLYYDLMNLYGENGNVRALVKHLENANIPVEVHFKTVDDKIDFKKFDVYYMGMGTEGNQAIVLKDILQYKEDIKQAIEDNKLFIITGNSIELFGKYIEDLEDKKHNSLNCFDYYTKIIDFRIVGEQVYKTSLIDQKIIGFNNRSGVIKECKTPLFDVLEGIGYEPKNNQEGIIYKNFFGTYLLGPILIRNPYLTDYLLSKLIDDYKIDINTIEYKAYEEFIKNFVE